ncbi:hypothetical protein LL14B4_03235 [Lactococcus lactis subsp. lactis]|uniref:Multidrug resistance efflux transporter family protein n=2 Tax=Streptococcaceae TaxID=1300 RepID=A0A2Z3KI43_LACLL|nr:hypothetical protein LL14B4_03235 [Lactococcus lactis subsp. lactis]
MYYDIYYFWREIMIAIFIGVLSAFFFSLTFLLNQLMSFTGGNWLWTASLRFLFMLPLFIIAVAIQKNCSFSRIYYAIKERWQSWIIWSNVAFVLFYIPLSFASTLSPAWLIASTWQLTIISGSLLAPYIEETPQKRKDSRITKHDLFCFGIILTGIAVIEFQQISFKNNTSFLFMALILMVVAAISYPLGNRKIMKINKGEYYLSTGERILAMLICSAPVWVLCSIIGYSQSGLPSQDQLIMSLSVAFFSGFIATYLFFFATHLAHKNIRQLASVEATQSLEVIFTIVLGIVFLGDTLPNIGKIIGISLVLLGMVLKVLKINYQR